MQVIWQRLSNIGIASGLSFDEIRNIRLLNQLCLVIMPFLPVFLISDIYAGDFVGTGVTIGMFFWLASILGLQHVGWFRTAKCWFVFSLLLIITTLIMLYGDRLGGEYAYLGLIVAILILFNRQKEQLALVGLVLLAYGGSAYLQMNIYTEPLYADVVSVYSRPIYLVATMACIFLLTVAFIRANRFYAAKTNRLLEAVSQKNQSLEQQQNHIADQNKRLEQANEELEKFAYIASHDLKTPLRNINSFLTLTERRLHALGVDDEEIVEYLTFAITSAKQMYHLVGDILEFSRMNARDSENERVDLNKVLDRVTYRMSKLITDKHVSILQDALPIIRGNDARFMLMFQNLIENGIKYNESDQPMIRINCEYQGDRFVLRFEDNGIGLDMEYSEKIFDMFMRLHSVGEYLGSGIGLAICRKIVEQYGGEIWVEATEGSGSVFYAAFPVEMLEAQPSLEKA